MSILPNKRHLRAIRKVLPGSPKSTQELNHEAFICLLAKSVKPKVYVELGIYDCTLFNRMIPLVSEKLIGVDFVPEMGKHMKKHRKTEFFAGTTTDFAKELKKRGTVIDMLFIDADHSKEAVLEDFNNYFPMVKEDGIILLHDSYPKNKEFTQSGYCGDGYKAIFELSKKTDKYEMVTIPVHPGLVICRKRTKQMPWL